MIRTISDNTNPDSMASKARRKRFLFFLEQLGRLDKPIKILDVGGTMKFWEMMDFVDAGDVEIHLLNLEKVEVSSENFISVVGDATNLKEYGDNSFDLVFSNSVIEHVFTWENQQKMANEIERVGKNYFIQTPNYWFPIEPHFVLPLFQYMPQSIRVLLLIITGKYRDKKVAKLRVKEIKLLSIRQMKKLFPDSKIYLEKFLGLNKSITSYKIG